MNDESERPKSIVRSGSKTERSKVVTQEEDPLSKASNGLYEHYPKVKKENLTIRLEDEIRIVAAMSSAAKKQTTGSIFSVVVDISKTGTLGIGVKDLNDNILAVSMLKRENNQPGPGEEAGIRLGDVVFGVNFVPTREGSRTLINVIKKETQKQRKILHIQAWRCHQLCSDNIPGYLFPRADDVIVQAYSLFRTKVFSDWERWNFVEILLGHMLEDLKLRTSQPAATGVDETGRHVSSQSRVRAKQMQVLDLERNILQAKGLRTAICVRIVHTKSLGDTVIYVLRVEDVESGLQWVVHRRFRDFFSLNEELQDMSHFAKEAEFPRKRISIRNTQKLVENRIVALEQYVRKMLHTLTLYATMDSAASRSLRHLQNYLGVDRYVDCVHPPLVDDQRYIELMAYRFLNDFSSPACQQCVRFITTIDLDGIAEPGDPEGYRPVLTLVKDALAEVEQFVQQQHQPQMIQALRERRPDLDPEQLRSFVRKCIRRQVEAALYLPLRRNVFRIVYSFVALKSKQMQRSMTLLQQATPNYLMVDGFVQQARGLPAAVKAFRRVIQAYLPADQGQLLVEAAASVTELHRECHMEKQRLRALSAAGGSSADEKSVASGNESRNSAGSGFTGGGSGSSAGRTLPPSRTSGGVLKRPSGDTDSKPRLSGGSANGTASPAGSANGGNNAARRKSLSGIFRSKSSASVAPSVATSHEERLDLADPVGAMLRGAEDESVDSADHHCETACSSSHSPMSGIGGGGFHNEDEADRVSFTVSAADAPGSPHKVAVGASRQTGGGSQADGGLTSLSLDADSGAADRRQSRSSTMTSYEERKLQTRTAVEMLNSAIFDVPPPGESAGEQASVATGSIHEDDVRGNGGSCGGGIDAQFQQLQRHKSVRMTSLLNEMLDMNIQPPLPPPQSPVESQSRAQPADTEATEALDEPSSMASGDEAAPAGAAAADQQRMQRPRSEFGLFTDIEDAPADSAAAVEREGSVIISSTAEVQHEVISADDFLPLFTFVLVQAGLPQLLLVKELMVALVDDEDTYGECGYYLATLEAAAQHICDLADQYEKVARIDALFDDGEDIFEEHSTGAGSGAGQR